jgi:hypothetical protein
MNRPSTKSVFHPSLLSFALGAGLLAVAGTATAADARGVERAREVQQERREERASLPSPRGESQRPPQPRMAPPPPQPRMAPAPGQAQGGGAPPQLRPYRGGGNNDTRTYDRAGRPVVVGPPRGTAGPGARIVPPSRAYVTRAPRYVPSLPPGHRRYDWRGAPYYYGGGQWYRPYQNRFLVVGPPAGLFVSFLPSYYSTVWVGGTRYYMADDVYYTYEPSRRGYVVARSPYGDDRADDDYEEADDRDQDMFIYPMRGQSEQQQSDDRYECHRWAVKETRYDPTDSSYDRNDRSDYDRAISACLTGRGYSVK